MTRKHPSPQFLTKTEAKALLNRAKSKNYRDYVMLLLGLRHGLRASEIVNITLDSIDLESGNIHCHRLKNSISNWQALAKDETKAIKCWLRKRPKCDGEFLFVSSVGRPIGRVRFYYIFKQLAEQIGLPESKRHPHVLKHSIASWLANAGCPLQVIRARLGHRSIASTLIYTSISSKYVDEAFSAALASGGVV